MNSPQQLSLSVSLSDYATFDNFFVPADGSNAQSLALLCQQLEGGENFIYLWGGEGAGLSHLLQAACHQALDRGLSAAYLPLAEMRSLDPRQVLAELETLDFLALDDLQCVAGERVWEESLFHLYNGLRDGGKRLLVAARTSPRELTLGLEDLRSRLMWGLTLQLYPLSDTDKRLALQSRARARGLELNDEVASYLMQRLPRSTHELFEQLQRLDEASLAEQRRLTIPFVKRVLGL
jgi:DnaA family protein